MLRNDAMAMPRDDLDRHEHSSGACGPTHRPGIANHARATHEVSTWRGESGKSPLLWHDACPEVPVDEITHSGRVAMKGKTQNTRRDSQQTAAKREGQTGGKRQGSGGSKHGGRETKGEQAGK